MQAKLANKLNVNLWATVPPYAEDAYVTSWATAALSSLNSNLLFEPEYANEVWNFSFPSTQWATQRGLALGFPLANNEATYGWYSLRVRQIMGNLIQPVWSGNIKRLRRTLMVQAFGDASQNTTYRLKSADLAPSGTSTGKGNSVYNTYTSSADYTAKPNRAVDVVETIGYAPYTAGTNFSDQGSNGGTVATAANATVLQNMATLAAANPSDPAVLSLFDADQRQGTTLTQTFSCPAGTTITLASHGFVSGNKLVFTNSGGALCSGLLLTQAYCPISVTTNTFQVANWTSAGVCDVTPITINGGSGTQSVGAANATALISLVSTIFPIWETVAAGFDSDRPTGASPLRVEWYEGAPQPVTPSAATLTSIGVLIPAGTGTGAAANTALQNLLNAWKQDTRAANFMVSYYKQFMGTDNTVPSAGLFPHSKSTSHLVLPGAASCASQYGLLAGALPNSAVCQTYNGFAQFSMH